MEDIIYILNYNHIKYEMYNYPDEVVLFNLQDHELTYFLITDNSPLLDNLITSLESGPWEDVKVGLE